jgi:iron complex outermembrane recepter protein
MKKIILSALAATAVYAENIDLGDVTVTATRSDVNATDLQVSVLKASKEDVATTVLQKDLLNGIAGVLVSQTTSVVGHMISIRTGITTAPRFLFLQDNIPVQSSGFFNHNGLAYTNFQSAGDAEVLKGAGTALYGSDAVAGTVNVQTPNAKDFNGTSVSAQGGSYGYANVNVKHGNKTEDGSYYIGASQTHSDGWREHTTFDRSELTVKSDNTLNDENSLKTIFTANQSDAEQSGSIIGLDALLEDPSDIGDLDISVIDAKRKFDFARLSAEWSNYSFDDVEINTIAYTRFNRNRYTATWENNKPQNDAKQLSVGLMNKNTIEKDWGKVLFGFDAEYTNGKSLYTQSYDYVAGGGWGDTNVSAGTIYDYTVNYLAAAPYVHSEMKMGKSWKATAGLRFDYNRFDYTNNTDDGQYDVSNYLRVGDRVDSFSHLSPKASLSYKANQNNITYFRFANGFRIPQASRLYQLKTDNISFTLNPETTNTFEVGYKHKGKQHAIQTAVYYMSIDDTITRYENSSGDRYYDNGETTHHYGIETTLKSAFSKTWGSKVSYAYSQHKFGEDDPDYAGKEEEAAPNHITNAQLIMTPESVNGLKVVAEVQAVSSYFMDNDNTKEYEGYIIGNIKAFYKLNKAWSFMARVTNITDKIYAEKASFAYGKEKYTPAGPREFLLSATYKF